MEQRFDELYNLYNKDVYRLTFSYSLKVQDAEDVTQKVFYKLYRNRKILVLANDEVKRWLFRVCVNESKDLLRSSFRKVVNLDDNVKVKELETNIDLVDALSKIDSEYRIPLYLFYYEGYSIHEIASIIKKSESAVKMRLSRGREKLKQEMGRL